jgi:hypothetical protein
MSAWDVLFIFALAVLLVTALMGFGALAYYIADRWLFR